MDGLREEKGEANGEQGPGRKLPSQNRGLTKKTKTHRRALSRGVIVASAVLLAMSRAPWMTCGE
jgi:hypothetical protein